MQIPKPDLNLEALFDRLWPLARSITGNGFRESLRILQEFIPLEQIEIPSGTKLFDWEVPPEWNIREAFLIGPDGRRVLDFTESNLHVLGYSEPFEGEVDLEELQAHLYSLPDLPDAIPYVTSYYKSRWGFCLPHRLRTSLKSGRYKAVIRSSLDPTGSMTIGNCILPATGQPEGEVLISTYLCHPSMANNELSGPLAAAWIFSSLSQLRHRRFSYQFVVVPETIGSLAVLQKFGAELKKRCVGGLVITCCAIPTAFTYKRSRIGNAAIDRCAENLLKNSKIPFKIEDFRPTGSDERQYCSPGFNLPIGSLMRGKYATYPEYHTSFDNKSLISFQALTEAAEKQFQLLLCLEKNRKYRNLSPYGEPQLGRRGLYPTTGAARQMEQEVEQIMHILNYSDGEHDLCEIANKLGATVLEVAPIAERLCEAGLLAVIEEAKL